MTVTNLEQGNLIISAMSFGGANPGDFAKTSDTCTGATLTYNGTCTVGITFTPQAGGTRTASLSLTDNASNSSVTLTGTGAVTTASLSPTSLSFGSQMVYTTSAALTETVTNTGTATLVITAIIFSGTNWSRFCQDCRAPAPAPTFPQCHLHLGVTFTPWAMGIQSGSLILTRQRLQQPWRR